MQDKVILFIELKFLFDVLIYLVFDLILVTDVKHLGPPFVSEEKLFCRH